MKLVLVRALFLETVAAVDGLVAARLERNFCGSATTAARRAEHLALCAVTRAIHPAAAAASA